MAAAPHQCEPAGVGQPETVSSAVRGSSPPTVVMTVVSLLFTSQVGVSSKKRICADVCVCRRMCVCARVHVCAHVCAQLSFEGYFSIRKAIEKPTHPYKVDDTT